MIAIIVIIVVIIINTDNDAIYLWLLHYFEYSVCLC